jgi:hemolysin III
MNAVSKSTIGEEVLNAITHGLGACFAVAALPIMLLSSHATGRTSAIVGAAIFGSAMVILYTISTLYHSLPSGTAKSVFQRLDHISIYLLIAGTYTPFTLCVLKGDLGWTIFGLVWGFAVCGITFKSIFGARYDVVSAILYVVMGWMILFAIQSVIEELPVGGLIFLVAGGAFYTLGVPFYLLDTRKKWFHGIWHCFVLSGSCCHFIAVNSYVFI